MTFIKISFEISLKCNRLHLSFSQCNRLQLRLPHVCQEVTEKTFDCAMTNDLLKNFGVFL